MREDKILEILNNATSKTGIAKEMGWSTNGRGIKKVNQLLEEYGIDYEEIKKRSIEKYQHKYERITKECPVCGTEFTTKKGHKKEKTVCSVGCANTYYRTGENHPNWKEDSYRTTCFVHHKKECIVCGEDKIVDVHHYDHDKTNNNPENLIPLCRNHHAYHHSRYAYLVDDIIEEYRDNFIKENNINK